MFKLIDLHEQVGRLLIIHYFFEFLRINHRLMGNKNSVRGKISLTRIDDRCDGNVTN